MKETGIVIDVYNKSALVSLQGGAGCESCTMGCCSVRGKERVAEAYNPVNAKKGDEVEVVFEERALLLGSALVYIFPLGMFLAGYTMFFLASTALGFQKSAQIAGIVGAFSFIFLSFFVLSFLFKRGYLQTKRFVPVIERIIERV